MMGPDCGLADLAARALFFLVRNIFACYETQSIEDLLVSAKVIDGLAVAKAIRAEAAHRVKILKKDHNIDPGLAVIIAGDDPASKVYVRNKIRACEEVGIKSTVTSFPSATTSDELREAIVALNADESVHGILVQLPLPLPIMAQDVIGTIAADKDVDGFHLYNVGSLVVGGTIFPPCTPYGVVRLLEHEKIAIEGKNVVVVGASNIVGKPMALMMMQKDATVSICHAKTRDLAQYTILADILIVAAGKPNLITAPMVKTGAVVIDVGINRLPDGRLVGDVDFAAVSERASYITPVPGGIGPMTVTMLIVNTIASAERKVRS
jgi:methylenetetrahydrofolate dehydrogenase (NADP+)/methenyltetrahydrofolate cyclohydrolase